MKIGDLVIYKWRSPHNSNHPGVVGTVLSFPVASHPKEFQKVKVLTEDGLIEDWIMQFCEVVNSNQENDKIEAGSIKES